jgi:hypothetical protein
MWKSRRLTTLWTSTASYKDSFIFFNLNILKVYSCQYNLLKICVVIKFLIAVIMKDTVVLDVTPWRPLEVEERQNLLICILESRYACRQPARSIFPYQISVNFCRTTPCLISGNSTDLKIGGHVGCCRKGLSHPCSFTMSESDVLRYVLY